MLIDDWLQQTDMNEWVMLALFVIGFVALAAVYKLITIYTVRRLGDRTLSLIIRKIYYPIVATVAALIISVGATLLEIPQFEFLITASVFSIVVILWAFELWSIANEVIRNRKSERLKFAPVIANVISILIVVVTLFLMLDIWGVDVTPLLASAGILGIVIGFAAQDTISNLAAGISIYFDKTFVVGDFITLSSGERGTVVDISIRSTTILTRDNVTITVPNAEFNRQLVENETAPVRPRRLRLNVSVAYGSDLDTVETALLEAVDEIEHVSDYKAPEVKFRSFDDSAITAQVQFYINHPSRRGTANDELIRAINTRFREHEIKIPFPQREVTFFESGNEIRIADDREADQ